MKTQKGFTLLELLIVVIIVGILAAVGMSQFSKAIDKSREAEGVNVIGAIFTAEMVYYYENNTFTTNLRDLTVTIPTMHSWATPIIVEAIGNTGPGNQGNNTTNGNAVGALRITLKGQTEEHHHPSHTLTGEIYSTMETSITVKNP